jgi:hypothetical protein
MTRRKSRISIRSLHCLLPTTCPQRSQRYRNYVLRVFTRDICVDLVPRGEDTAISMVRFSWVLMSISLIIYATFSSLCSVFFLITRCRSLAAGLCTTTMMFHRWSNLSHRDGNSSQIHQDHICPGAAVESIHPKTRTALNAHQTTSDDRNGVLVSRVNERPTRCIASLQRLYRFRASHCRSVPISRLLTGTS